MNIHKNARLTPQGRALLVLRVQSEGWRVRDATALGGSATRHVLVPISRDPAAILAGTPGVRCGVAGHAGHAPGGETVRPMPAQVAAPAPSRYAARTSGRRSSSAPDPAIVIAPFTST